MISRRMIESRLEKSGVEITPEHRRIMNVVWSNVPLAMPPMEEPVTVPDEYPGTAEWLKVIVSKESKISSVGLSASVDLPF